MADQWNDSPSSPVFYASISNWEYGCCGEPPAVDNRVDVTVEARPATTDEASFVAPAVTGWDADREIVHFGDLPARWSPEHGSPYDRPLSLGVSWHSDNPVAPRVAAVITSVYEESVMMRRTPTGWEADYTGVSHRRVTALPRFSEMDTAAADDDEDEVLRPWGAVLGLDLRSATVPSEEVMAAELVTRERASRTIWLTGPATVFGPTVPGRDERIEVDLADPRLERSGACTDLRHLVHGVTGQVSIVTTSGDGFTSYGNVQSGIPTSEVDRPLAVALTIDSQDLPGK